MTMTFLAGSTWPAGVLSSTSPTSSTLLAILLAQADDDRVLVAGFAEQRGLRAGDVGADRVGHAGHRQAEQGRLVAIDADGEFRPALVAADARVGDAGRRVQHRLDVLREALRVVEIVAADLERERGRRRCRRGCAASAGCRRTARARTMTPGMPASCAAQRLRDLLAGARALVLRHQPDGDVAAVRSAAAEAAAAAAAAPADQHRRLGHDCRIALLERA